MPKDYYLYRDKTEIKVTSPAGVTAGEPDWPSGIAHHDEHFGDTIVYFDQVEVPVPLNGADPSKKVELDVAYQGCLENGICYPVMTRHLVADLASGTVTVSEPSDATSVGASSRANEAPQAADVAPTPPPATVVIVPGGSAASAIPATSVRAIIRTGCIARTTWTIFIRSSARKGPGDATAERSAPRHATRDRAPPSPWPFRRRIDIARICRSGRAPAMDGGSSWIVRTRAS